MLFTVLTLSELGIVLGVRSERDSLFHQGFLSNQLLLGAVLLTFGWQLLVIYLPLFQNIFMTEALSILDLSVCTLIGSLVMWAIELKKWMVRQQQGVRSLSIISLTFTKGSLTSSS